MTRFWIYIVNISMQDLSIFGEMLVFGVFFFHSACLPIRFLSNLTFMMIFSQKDTLYPFVNWSKAWTQKCWNCFIYLSRTFKPLQGQKPKEGRKGKMLSEIDQPGKIHIKSLSPCKTVYGLWTSLSPVEENSACESNLWINQSTSSLQLCPFWVCSYTRWFINHI